MQRFNFQRIVQKNSSEFKVVILLSKYLNDSGDWVQGETKEITLEGALIKHRTSKIFNSNGKLTSKDMALYRTEPIEQALYGANIVYEDESGKNVYHIENYLENAKFTGVWAYTLKYVSAFNKELQGTLNEATERFGKRLDGETV